MEKKNNITHPVLLFDGVCNLCDGFVQWLIQRDTNQVFRYAALQSEAGSRLLQVHQFPTDEINTVILIEGDQVYTHADVSLRIAQLLGGAWKATGIFYVVPSPIRNSVYNLVARNRYRFFGKKEQCMIPTPELQGLFLQ
ncbi:MAG: thiol-disulfide oxidoreductase DCC family protein [Bacteroidota bacterium]